jgi:cell division septation protein DedD
MMTTCPSCGIQLNLQTDHVGRRFRCKKCQAELLMQETGPCLIPLAVQARPSPPRPPEAVAVAVAPPSTAVGPGNTADQADLNALLQGAGNFLRRLPDVPTWLFGAGILLIILFTFFPLIDEARIAHLRSRLAAGELRLQRSTPELMKKGDDYWRKTNEKWDEQSRELQQSQDEAAFAAESALYWYRYGSLLGYMLLAAGSLGFLKSSQTTHRVVGGVVLVALVLIVFSSLGKLGMKFELSPSAPVAPTPLSAPKNQPGPEPQKDTKRAD